MMLFWQLLYVIQVLAGLLGLLQGPSNQLSGTIKELCRTSRVPFIWISTLPQSFLYC